MSEFKEFLQDEITRRGMSARQFAEFLDVAPSTVSRCIDEKNPSLPGLDFLLKIARATGVSITSLVHVRITPPIKNACGSCRRL